MLIRDLPKDKNLRGVRFIAPNGAKYYWYSQWGYPDGKAGVWAKVKMEETQMYPIFLDKLSEASEWEIVSGEK